MKILHINCNYMGTRLHQTMIEHLDGYVDENTVFCPIYSGSDIVTRPRENVIVSKCFTFADRFFFFKKQKKIITSVEQNTSVGGYDCIHAYTLFTDGNCACELGKKYGIPFVVAIRATDFQFFDYRPNLRKRGLQILSAAAKIFFLSEKTKEIFLKKYVPEEQRTLISEKIRVIPNGIDDFWLENAFHGRDRSASERRIAGKELNIVCVSQIIRRKNIPALQRAAEALSDDGWKIKLTVIGKGTDKKLLDTIKNDKNTTYISPVEKEKLIDYYREADLFALASKGETFGLVYAEAMTQGLPVIYSLGEGFDGQFEDGAAGYGINPSDVGDIKRRILDIAANYGEISARVPGLTQRFKWDSICGEYAEIYSSIT